MNIDLKINCRFVKGIHGATVFVWKILRLKIFDVRQNDKNIEMEHNKKRKVKTM